MDWLVVAFIATQAVLLAIAVTAAVGRGRTLDAIRDATEEAAHGEDVAGRVRRIVDQGRAAAWALAQQRRDAAYLADLISVGVIHLDDELRVDLANAASQVFLDVAQGGILGRTAMEAFVDGRIEAIVAAARDQGSATGEVDVGRADGPTLVVRARRSPVTGVWVVLDDVTELRRLQQIRAEFIDNLSHELRTPLSTISLLAETLARDADAAPSVPSRMRDRIAKIEVETGHLVQMVNELLDLTRIEAGGSVLLLDDVDLGRVAVASAERLRLFAERQGVRMRVEAGEATAPIRGDGNRLGQVFVNLLHNAVKFSPNGGDVTIRVADRDGEVLVAIQDHGVGIPRQDLGRIFERFYKVDRARLRGGGTGLGLAISRHIVEQHGGRIWVEAEEGRGSTFSFAIPVAGSAEPA